MKGIFLVISLISVSRVSQAIAVDNLVLCFRNPLGAARVGLEKGKGGRVTLLLHEALLSR